MAVYLCSYGVLYDTPFPRGKAKCIYTIKTRNSHEYHYKKMEHQLDKLLYFVRLFRDVQSGHFSKKWLRVPDVFYLSLPDISNDFSYGNISAWFNLVKAFLPQLVHIGNAFLVLLPM